MSLLNIEKQILVLSIFNLVHKSLLGAILHALVRSILLEFLMLLVSVGEQIELDAAR